MRAETLLLFHFQYRKSGFFCHRGEFRRFVNLHIAVSDQICQRHLQMIHQPDNNIGRSIVPQDQVAALLQNAESCLHFSVL